jgi:G:T-mismatch repair DNA endonuclease (very short patch repair protein)
MRDRKARGSLTSLGWRVITIWECQTRDTAKLDQLLSKLLTFRVGNTTGVSITY